MIGYRCYRGGSFDWRRHHQALIPLGMPHISPPINVTDVRLMLVKCCALFARWDEEFDQLSSGEWWHVVKDKPEDLDSLSGNTRSKIRRGKKKFEVMKIASNQVCKEGYEVYKAAFDRYNTFERILSEEDFQKAIAELPEETEFWAVRESATGRMVAFSENLVRDHACFYATIWFEPEALRAYAGYVLIYEMNMHYLNERRLTYVTDGARSISHQTNIHEFLEQKFAFRRAYSQLRIVYAPGVGAMMPFLYPLRRLFRNRKSAFFQKIWVLLEQERIRRACVKVEVDH